MFDWYKNKTTKSSVSEPIDRSAQVRVIGDRASGKTAYMASLAYWPNANSSSPVQTVTPLNDDTNELVENAQNILEQGLQLGQTDLKVSVEDVQDYSLSIVLKGQFSWKEPKVTLQPQLVKLNINCRDYSGEFFSDLLHKTGDSHLTNYLEDCLLANGIMFLADGTSHRKDSEYANGLDKFLIALDRTDISRIQRRIAFVMTKCEQSELWVNRHKPRELAQARFPQTFRKLQAWQQTGGGQVDYFTTSAFGILGNKFPEPNSIKIKRDRGGTSSCIKDPKRWRPFGLVAPIYWLCTGERHKELDKD
jgi:GTPase SAR1 family protein